MIKTRYLFLIFFAVLILLSWYGRTQLAALAISSVMHKTGLSDVSNTIRHLGTAHSQLSELSFSLPVASGRLHFELRDISIDYDIRQLSAGRIEQLNIDTLLVRHITDAEENVSAADLSDNMMPERVHSQPLSTGELAAMLRQSLPRYFLSDILSVQQINLQGDFFASLQGKTLSLHSNIHDTSLNAELTLLQPSDSAQQQPYKSRQLIIHQLGTDTLSAELRFAEDSNSVATLQLFIDEQMNSLDSIQPVSGNFRLGPLLLQQWLQPFFDINTSAQAGSIDGTFIFSIDKQQQLAATLTAQSTALQFDNYQADDALLKLKIHSDLSSPPLHINVENGSYVTASRFTDGEHSLAHSQIFIVGELAQQHDNWSYTGGIRSEPLLMKLQTHQIKLQALAARISLDGNTLQLDGDFSPDTVAGKFSFALEHHFEPARGRLVLKPLQAIDLETHNSRLSQLVSPWPYPFELLTGTIELWSQADWSADSDFRLTAKIELENGGGTVASEILFSGLNFAHELELLPLLHSLKPSDITLKQLDSGVTTSDISGRLSLLASNNGPLPELLLQGLHGEIFDGLFLADDVHFDLNNSDNHFTIRVDNIDLASIVETQQLHNIEVTGRVSGSIPVTINEQGVVIEHGALFNTTSAGIIRYDAGDSATLLQHSQLTTIALDALKDFRYSHLAADVNFTADGLLNINLQLQGRSPKLETDRPVHLNINTEQNLIALLKSLRFAQGISDDIDNSVRLQYEKARTNN